MLNLDLRRVLDGGEVEFFVPLGEFGSESTKGGDLRRCQIEREVERLKDDFISTVTQTGTLNFSLEKTSGVVAGLLRLPDPAVELGAPVADLVVQFTRLVGTQLPLRDVGVLLLQRRQVRRAAGGACGHLRTA